MTPYPTGTPAKKPIRGSSASFPSIGLAISSLGGAYVEDYLIGDQDYTLGGFNAGYFLDLLYKNVDFPLYAHLRFQGGDYAVTTIGIGGKF